MTLNLENIPLPPDWWDKGKLIEEILELTPIAIALESSALLRVCYPGEWDREALQRMSEWDLVVIKRWAFVTEDQIPIGE